MTVPVVQYTLANGDVIDAISACNESVGDSCAAILHAIEEAQENPYNKLGSLDKIIQAYNILMNPQVKEEPNNEVTQTTQESSTGTNESA